MHRQISQPFFFPDIPPEGAPVASDQSDFSCKACGCVLARNGDVLARGARYTRLLDLEDENRRLTAAVEQARAEVAALSERLAAATPKPDDKPAKRFSIV